MIHDPLDLDDKAIELLRRRSQEPHGAGVLQVALRRQYNRGYKDATTVDAIISILVVLVYWWLT